MEHPDILIALTSEDIRSPQRTGEWIQNYLDNDFAFVHHNNYFKIKRFVFGALV